MVRKIALGEEGYRILCVCVCYIADQYGNQLIDNIRQVKREWDIAILRISMDTCLYTVYGGF